MIPYSKQEIDQDDIDAVNRTLKSDYLTQGPLVSEFEKALAIKTKAKFGIAFNSATSALHAACSALGIKRGDNVWTSAITFASSANVALMCGAKVDFLDINLEHFNIDVDLLAIKLKQADKNKCLPKLIIVVHFCGESVDMKSIYNLSLQYDFKIIEDASHALGAKYQSLPVGSCEYSEMSIFSFHPVKMITTGEGGCITTNSKYLENKVRDFGQHGITKVKSHFKSKINFNWYYEQQSLGYNYRMNEISASLGLSQLKKLDYFISKRNELVNEYNKNLPEEIYKPLRDKKNICSYHLFPILVPDDLRFNRDDLYNFMHDNGFGVQVHYIPVYRHHFYRQNGFRNFSLSNSENYFKRCLSLPLFPSLTKNNLLEICSKINKWLSKSRD